MKKSIVFVLLGFIAVQCFSQTNTCDEVKRQNQKLNEKLRQYGIDITDSTTKINSYSGDIVVNFIKCTGDKKNQTVTVYFNVINTSLPNQTFYLNGSMNDKDYQKIITQAFDEIGLGYSSLKATLGSSFSSIYSQSFSNDYLSSKLSTGNFPVMASVTFMNVLSSVNYFRQIDICMNNKNLTGNDEGDRNRGITEIKNVKINWK